ncbi:hypothetical protein Patl1_12857 [Pistacia atlantica]|uniref:Uncharacterized protein n=1 Tax=Pistacia atlantica TaxID=434234 RepID=A0ACC1AYD5_9ROSI|nr:hypothetical protein Patl1_12857 [Pistacia atlantica]
MAANSRDSRRRKILERGSDRLAFIKGQLPSPPQQQFNYDSKTESPQPLISHETHLSDQITDFTDGENKGKNVLSGSTLLKEDPVLDAGHNSAHHNGSSEESPLPQQGTSIEDSRAPASEVHGVVQSSIFSSTGESESVSTSKEEQQLEPQRCQSRLFTPSQISSAISATEHIRLFCSVAVALLVVLSYVGFPLLGSNIIKSIISFRPLYLVLLTNLTIVLSRLLFDNHGGLRRAIRGENNIPSTDAYGWAEQASKALEVGLLAQKVINAIFMDCSVYSIIVICGLCFV